MYKAKLNLVGYIVWCYAPKEVQSIFQIQHINYGNRLHSTIGKANGQSIQIQSSHLNMYENAMDMGKSQSNAH